jgi:hypothetical protein
LGKSFRIDRAFGPYDLPLAPHEPANVISESPEADQNMILDESVNAAFQDVDLPLARTLRLDKWTPLNW